MTKDDALVAALADDYTEASLSEADHQMLSYADKLTRRPARITQADVTALKQKGFCDAAVLDIAQVAAYYAFVNRIASGLGVEIESPTT